MSRSRQPLVSVLIPCYNAGEWVSETLESVLTQSWSNIEVILVDDGSTDESVRVIGTFSDRRVRLIQQSNGGAGSARNRAFTESSGAYIQYLDADDLLSPRKIEIQLERLFDHPGCIASAEWARFKQCPEEAVFVPDDTWQDLAPVDWLVHAWSEGGGMLYPALWLVPREILTKAGSWRTEPNPNDDGEFFTRVILASDGVRFCQGARTFYRSGIPGSLSGLKSRRAVESQFRVIGLCQDYLLAREDSERTRRVCAMLWQRFAHASYPYARDLANRALDAAASLHPAQLRPEGGNAFRLVSRTVGWKAARVLQKWSGRP